MLCLEDHGITEHTMRVSVLKKKQRKQTVHDLSNTLVLSHSDIYFSVHYPEENKLSAINDITERLAHIGAFNGVASSQVA